MKRLKVITILGTRPDVIKLSRVIAELDKTMNHILVHTGQNYDHELNQIFFDELEIRKPDYFLNIASGDLAEDMANVIKEAANVLDKEKPDAILFYGDTNSTLAVIPAKRKKIPIFHMEAGNRCFDMRVPEEINRKIIDHLSDINLTISEHARQYLIREGLPANQIIKVGSCMQEVFQYYWSKIESSKILSKLKTKAQDYFIVSLHREDNVDSSENLHALLNALYKITTFYQKRIFISMHPRTRKNIEKLISAKHLDKLKQKLTFLKPFGFCDYIKLQINAYCVLSDSGSLTEEASILNFPAITLRRMHERPEGMDVGTLIMSGYNADRILQAIDIIVSQHATNKKQIDIVSDYQVKNVSIKIPRIITSYVDYINTKIWHKN